MSMVRCISLILIICYTAHVVLGFSPSFLSLSLLSFLSSRRDLLQEALFVVAATTSVMTKASSSSNSSSIRWGIIGLGDVTQQKSGPPFYKCAGSQLVAVMRRTPGKAAAWAARVPGGVCTGYDNLQEFLQHPGLQAVYVATRPDSHLELCQQVAAAGKAIYVEMPVGRRAYQRTQSIRTLLQEGAVGDRVTSVRYKLVGLGGARGMQEGKTVPWRLDAKQSGGGLVMDVGCHVVDRIDWLCGPLENVSGKAEQRLGSAPYAVEDFVTLQATIGSSSWAAVPSEGAEVLCMWNFSGISNESECDELIISGSKGSLKMAAMSPCLPVQVLDENGSLINELRFDTPEHTAQEMIQSVTNELRGVGSDPFLSTGDNAIRTSKVLDAALASYYGDRRAGYWMKQDEWPGRPASQSSLSKSN